MFDLIFNKKYILKYAFFSTLLLILYFIFHKDLHFFLFLTYGIKGILGIIVMVIAINTYKISQNTILTFLAISIGFCGLVDFFSVIFSYHYGFNSVLSNHIYLQVFVDFLNVFSLILCFKLYDKKVNFKLVFIFYSVIIILFLLFFIFSLFIFDIFPSIYKIVLFNFSLKDILNFVLFIFSLYPLYAFNKFRNEIRSRDVQSIFSCSILFTISMFVFFISPSQKQININVFIANILTILYVYLVCRIILNAVLKEPYNVLFYNLDKKSKEFQKTKNDYETLIEKLPISIIITRNNKIHFANQASVKLFDYKEKLDIYDMKFSNLLKDNSTNYFNKDDKFFETQFQTYKGNFFEGQVTSIDIVFNQLDCKIFIIKDISYEKKVLELNRTLERKLEEENLRTEFFSNISHELRTPINVIYSVLQLEDIYIKNKNIEAIEKHHKTLKQNCLRLLRICNNLIDVTKIDAGFFKPNMTCVNIVSLIEDIVSSVALYTRSMSMNIIFDTEEEEIYSLCDNDLIERIILNLISNSIKYGSDNGNIWIDICLDNEFIKIIFKDDGPGIPKEICDDIFERFIQVDRSLNRSCEGSGLGLSLVKSLIELHNGTITLNSDLGLGCEFVIMIPSINCNSHSNLENNFFIEDNSLIDKINIEFSDIYI